MKTQSATHNGFMLGVSGAGSSWHFDIFDPNAPEAHPLGRNYADIDQAKDAAVHAANRHLAVTYPMAERTKDPITWHDRE